MRTNDRNHGVRKFHALQNFGAHHWMDFHLLELGSRQLARFGNNGFRDRQFPDVVQNGGGGQSFQLLLRKAQILADLDGIELHALQMIVRSVILGVDRERQRFDGSQMQSVDRFCMCARSCSICDQMGSVGTMHQVDQRQADDRKFPLNAMRQRADHPRHGGAHRVIGQRPAIIAPNLEKIRLPSVKPIIAAMGKVLAQK